jgi:hypothetical protein
MQAPEFRELLEATAARYGVPERALTVRTLLHLPRLARSDGSVGIDQVRLELRHNAERLQRDEESIAALIPADRYPLGDLHFVRIGDGVANRVFSTLHYLRSARPGSLNFALVDPVQKLPVTLCSVTPLEWMRVGRQLQAQFGVPMGAAWDVSRVYSFSAAPANAISYLLSRVRQVIRREIPDAQVLTTAVDPNLGFVGASYRAANWQEWMSIKARPYLYVDGSYASPRQLRTRFGGANLTELRAAHRGHRFEQSHAGLLDSKIFCHRASTACSAADLCLDYLCQDLPGPGFTWAGCRPRTASGPAARRCVCGPASSWTAGSRPTRRTSPRRPTGRPHR